jgi:hypothetical protein
MKKLYGKAKYLAFEKNFKARHPSFKSIEVRLRPEPPMTARIIRVHSCAPGYCPHHIDTVIGGRMDGQWACTAQRKTINRPPRGTPTIPLWCPLEKEISK